MKIDVMENGLFKIKEISKPFVLENINGTQLAISMKDDGYELLIDGIVSMKQIDDDATNKQVLDSMKVAFSLKDIRPSPSQDE